MSLLGIVATVAAISSSILSRRLSRPNSTRELLFGGCVFLLLLVAAIDATSVSIEKKRGLLMTSSLSSFFRYRATQNRVTAFEEQLTHAATDREQEGTFNVVMLGDSTFIDQADFSKPLPFKVRELLQSSKPSRITLSYMYEGGFDVFHYYFLMNYVLKRHVDLVVIPVNLRSFGDEWTSSVPNFAPYLARYLELRELPFAMAIRGHHDEIRISHVLAYKLDYYLFNQRAHRFLNDSREQFQSFLDPYLLRYSKLFTATPESAKSVMKVLPDQISAKHRYIPTFRHINEIALRNGITVMYYGVPVNPNQVRSGEVNEERLFAQCESLFGGASNVVFIRFRNQIPGKRYLIQEHLDSKGLDILARLLANEIASMPNSSGD